MYFKCLNTKDTQTKKNVLANFTLVCLCVYLTIFVLFISFVCTFLKHQSQIQTEITSTHARSRWCAHTHFDSTCTICAYARRTKKHSTVASIQIKLYNWIDSLIPSSPVTVCIQDHHVYTCISLWMRVYECWSWSCVENSIFWFIECIVNIKVSTESKIYPTKKLVV